VTLTWTLCSYSLAESESVRKLALTRACAHQGNSFPQCSHRRACQATINSASTRAMPSGLIRARSLAAWNSIMRDS
jgi:hypothetical protein